MHYVTLRTSQACHHHGDLLLLRSVEVWKYRHGLVLVPAPAWLPAFPALFATCIFLSIGKSHAV